MVSPPDFSLKSIGQNREMFQKLLPWRCRLFLCRRVSIISGDFNLVKLFKEELLAEYICGLMDTFRSVPDWSAARGGGNVTGACHFFLWCNAPRLIRCHARVTETGAQGLLSVCQKREGA